MRWCNLRGAVYQGICPRKRGDDMIGLHCGGIGAKRPRSFSRYWMPRSEEEDVEKRKSPARRPPTKGMPILFM